MPDAERETPTAPENLDRARVYRALADLFRLPDEGVVKRLVSLDLRELRTALERLGADDALTDGAEELARRLARFSPERLREAYHATFEASGDRTCTPNETSHTADTPQQALVRTFELADVAGFYRAFGMEIAPGSERPDHISVELEFMQLLAVKEAVALQEEGDGEHVYVCRDAARSFLSDHLGRWAGRFAERVETCGADPFYAVASRLLGGFVSRDAERLGAA